MERLLRATESPCMISPTLKKSITPTASVGWPMANAPPVATVIRKFSSKTRPCTTPRNAPARTFQPTARYATPNTASSIQGTTAAARPLRRTIPTASRQSPAASSGDLPAQGEVRLMRCFHSRAVPSERCVRMDSRRDVTWSSLRE